MAVKKYLSALLEDLEKEKRAIEFYLRDYPVDHGKAEKLLTESTEFQNLLSPYFSPLSKELDDIELYPDYVKRIHSKLQLYTSNNIMPGINLITTNETKEKLLTNAIKLYTI